MGYMEDMNTPFQPLQPQPEPQLQKPNNKKRLTIVVVAVAFGTIGIVAVLLFLFVRSTESDKQNKQAKPTFTDWLKPSEELRIGDFRYVSACRLLPEDAVTKIFGKLSATSTISETYIDQNLPNPRNEAYSPPDTDCIYDGSQRIRIEVQHMMEKDNLNDSRYSSALPSDQDKMNEIIKRFEGVKGVSGNSDAKAFLEHLKASSAKYKKYDSARGDFARTASETMLNGVTVPDRKGIEDFAFVGIHKDLVITISHNLGERARDDEAGFSDDELAKELAMMGRAFAEVRKNASNNTLSQSPAPTVRGATDKLGTTKLLEACKVLDDAAFEAVTGIKPNDEVERRGLPLDPSIEQKASNGSILLPSSECARGYRAGALPDEYQLSAQEERYGRSGYLVFRFDINHANSLEQAEAQWAKYLEGFRTKRMIESSADGAFFWGSGDHVGGAIFKVGPYIASVSFTAAHSVGSFREINDLYMDEASHVAAINQLTTNIRSAQQQQ